MLDYLIIELCLNIQVDTGLVDYFYICYKGTKIITVNEDAEYKGAVLDLHNFRIVRKI